MGSFYWIKVYHEILDDPKVGRLPDRLFRLMILVFLLAGEFAKNGELPPIEDIAWRLRPITVEELLLDLEELSTSGIVHQDDGRWFVTNFSKRQAPISSSERGKKFRSRERKKQLAETQTQTERKANETFTEQEQDTDIEQETDEDEEQQQEQNGVVVSPSAVSEQTYQQLLDLGVTSRIAKTLIQEYPDDYLSQKMGFYNSQRNIGQADGPGWLVDAIKGDWIIGDSSNIPCPDCGSIDRCTFDCGSSRQKYVRGEFSDAITH